MDDDVKKALEAAIDASGLEHDGYARVIAGLRLSDAIAAFLLDRARSCRREPGMQVYADFLESEAAAVERAAKEGA